MGRGTTISNTLFCENTDIQSYRPQIIEDNVDYFYKYTHNNINIITGIVGRTGKTKQSICKWQCLSLIKCILYFIDYQDSECNNDNIYSNDSLLNILNIASTTSTSKSSNSYKTSTPLKQGSNNNIYISTPKRPV